MTAASLYVESFLAGLRPDADLSVAEWANTYRVLSQKGAAEPGPYRIERTPYLKEIAECLSPNDPTQRIVFMKSAQVGAPLDIETPIPTKSGWVKMGALKVGDSVFDETGNLCKVTGLSPIFVNRKCFEITFSDGEKIVCDAEHLWTVQNERNYSRRKIQTLKAGEIQKSFKHGNRNVYAIELHDDLHLPKKKLPIDPYVLGLWLGDGNRSSNQLTQHEDDADEMAAFIREAGYQVTIRRPSWVSGKAVNMIIDPLVKNGFCIRGHSLTDEANLNKAGKCKKCAVQNVSHWKTGKERSPIINPKRTNSFLTNLAKLKLNKKKRIPKAYLRASPEQRIELLRGLLDTDGSVDKMGKRVEFTSSCYDLTQDVIELIRSLGYKPTTRIRYSSSKFTNSTRWNLFGSYFAVSFVAYSEKNVFKLNRKASLLRSQSGRRVSETFRRRIVDVKEVVTRPVRCISVNSTNNLFLAGKGMIATHNSEIGFSWLGFIIHSCPGPTMMIQPTTELAEKVSKQRIASMIEETPVLREIIGPEKAKTTGQTVLLKEFRGGVLSITGANSPVGLRSMPVRFLFFDELDAAPLDLSGEGDPLSLAEKRTTTFARRKVFVVSTPTVKDSSRIEAEFLKSDQRRYFVPCPHCGVLQYLKWSQVKWVDDNPSTTFYECEHCKGKIEERHKTQMLAAGEWQATAVATDGITRGYHISSLYSPVGWRSWAEIVNEFIQVRTDAPRLKTWVNTVLGETWEEEYTAKLGSDELRTRTEFYEPGTAPDGVLVVTAGVDVQDNRFAISRYGWGKDEECWLIDHQEIFGDPSRPDIWKQLDTVLALPIKHESGREIFVKVAGIDSGGSFTHEVYQYTRERRAKNYLAIKGQSQRGKPAIGKPARVDVSFRGQMLKSGALVYPVGSDTVKSVLYGRLKMNEIGPGYLHIPAGTPDNYFSELTAERQVTRYVRGFPVKEWICKGRNEALDCFVYAYSSLQFVLNQYNRRTVWAQLEAALGAAKPKQIPQETVRNNPEPLQNKAQNQTIRRPGRGFVTRY